MQYAADPEFTMYMRDPHVEEFKMIGRRQTYQLAQLAVVLTVIATSTQILNATALPIMPSRDTILSGQIICSRIEVPAGVTLTASEDLVIESDDEIVIRGTLETKVPATIKAASGIGPTVPGVSITLRAKNRVVIDGIVRAGAGSVGVSGIDLDAAHGSDGGSVTIDAPILIGRGEVLAGTGGDAAAGGHGGNGGSIQVLGVSGSYILEDPLILQGGHGGAGGAGGLMHHDGGNGGDGGDAFAVVRTDGNPGDPGSDVIGTNGLCGFTSFTPCSDGPDGTAGASATGGNGGPGGDATSGGQGGFGGRGGNAVGGQGGCGGDGRNCTSGQGGDGGNGNNGGSATGGRGGNGGDGGAGCPSAVGGPGGNGGVGGNATGGKGGDGGDGGTGGSPPFVLLGAGGNGANGGNATAGSGGHGGHGGVGVAGGPGGAAGSSGSRVAGAAGLAGSGAPAGTPGSGGSTVSGNTGTAGATGASCSGNSVYIESKSVQSGETNVTLGIFLSNLIPLEAFALPLEIRSVTAGSFIANSFDLSVTPGKRVASLSPPMSYVDQERGAVSPTSCSGPLSHSFAIAPIDFSSPNGALFIAQRTIGPSLPAGSDPAGTANASLQLIFDVTSTPGTFEIDTCCCNPANHLGFIDGSIQLQIPSFFKGVVTILPCACDCHGDPVCDGTITNVQDVVATIGVAFRGAPAIPDPSANCPFETTDVDCDGITGIIDVVKVVNVTFRGINPMTEFCDPCP